MRNIVFFIFFLSISCVSDTEKSLNTAETSYSVLEGDVNTSIYHVVPFSSSFGGYGYKILSNEDVIISQESIPCISGLKGFQTEEDAIKVGMFVKTKLDSSIMPPSITVEDLKSLEVI
jgi:hypothetical protein